MAKAFIWSPPAENDLSQILDNINKNRGADVVNRFLDLLFSFLEQIIF